GVAEQPALRAPIVALTLLADTLVAVTPEQLAWRDPASGRWTVLRTRAELGRVTALAPDVTSPANGGGGGVGIAGTGGRGLWRVGRATFRVLTVPLAWRAAL